MSFLEFTCQQCTRRLSLSRLLTRPSSKPSSNNLILGLQATPPPPPPPSHHLSRRPALHSTPRRFYATAPKGRIGVKVETRNLFAKANFTRADVPPLEFWAAHVKAPLFADLRAGECLHAAQTYVDAALENAPGWRKRLIVTDEEGSSAQSPDGRGTDDGTHKALLLSAYTLHYVAVIIMTGAGSGSGQARNIAAHILHTLTGLDYAPSVLTLVRIALETKVIGRPGYERAVEALERMLRRLGDGSGGGSGSGSGNISASSKDGRKPDLLPDFAADACTLRALIYAAEDTREGDNNALRWFRRAYEVDAAATAPLKSKSKSRVDSPTTTAQGGKAGEDGNGSGGTDPFNPRWQWKPSFALGVAAIRMKRGETAKARAMYAMASAELDTATGYAEMAKLLEKIGEAGTDEYAAALEKAATSGDRPAARKMAERERARAAEAGLGRWEKRKRRVLAEEWMAIAGVSAPAEG
ncbi:hypothetical protein F5Y14DRAFT_412006 [Nemania sp. NC0429]|nr:hypothetical protein F5Y14DRAFT_412006 [Nemania sp. NC0429]